MLNKITALVLCFLFGICTSLFSGRSSSKGKITGLSKGEHAPYTGVLLDNVAAARIFSDKKYLEEQWT